MKLSQLKSNPNNPRLIKDDKFKKLVTSLSEFPEMMEKRPMVCVTDADGKLYPLGGNMRLKALQELKYKDIPDTWVVLADEWSEQKRKEFTIKDNVGFGDWDWDTLANEWNVEELTEWGLDIPNFEIDEVLEAKEDDFDVPEGGSETDIVLGDLFEIGEHRLLCGDSTDSDSVAKLMNGEKADMGFNDPPYGMKKESEGVLNDNLNYNDLLQFNKEWIALQFIHIKDNGSWYCWGTDEPLMDIYSEILKPYIKEQKATFRNLLTWDKGNGQGQLSEDFRMYPIADEKCLFVMCGVQGFNNNADNYFNGWEPIRKYLNEEMEKCGGTKNWRKALNNEMGKHYFTKSQWLFPTEENYKKLQAFGKEYGAFGKEYEQIKREYEQIKREYEQIKREYYSTRAHFDNTHDNQNNVWHFDRTTGEERESAGGHATPKPIALCSRAIKSSCPENGLVLDFFLGSGSTMVAAHQLKRKCYGMELDFKYAEVIVRRMIKLDNTLTIKRNDIDETQKWLDKLA